MDPGKGETTPAVSQPDILPMEYGLGLKPLLVWVTSTGMSKCSKHWAIKFHTELRSSILTHNNNVWNTKNESSPPLTCRGTQHIHELPAYLLTHTAVPLLPGTCALRCREPAGSCWTGRCRTEAGGRTLSLARSGSTSRAAALRSTTPAGLF